MSPNYQCPLLHLPSCTKLDCTLQRPRPNENLKKQTAIRNLASYLHDVTCKDLGLLIGRKEKKKKRKRAEERPRRGQSVAKVKTTAKRKEEGKKRIIITGPAPRGNMRRLASFLFSRSRPAYLPNDNPAQSVCGPI